MHAELDGVIREWQGVEHALVIAAKEAGADFSQVCMSNRPEAKALRDLDQRIAAIQEKLLRGLEAVRVTPATSIDGALAKVQLALLVQGPFDWRANARELAEGGIAELRAITQSGEGVTR